MQKLGSAILLVTAIALSGCATVRPTRPFPLAEPIWRDDDMQPFSPMPSEIYNPWAWDQLDNVAFRQLAELWAFEPSREAMNVNALDEVPDSSWFANRISRRPMTLDELRRGACASLDEPPKPWVVTRSKPAGTSPGLTIRAADGKTYIFKVDFWQPERNTASDSIATRLLYAAGYHTPCNRVVFFAPTDLELAPDARTSGEHPRPLEWADVERVVSEAGAGPDGLLRASLSEYIAGRPLGGFRFSGVRDDDPNDVFPHEHRRELRGLYVLSAWLNHIDTRAENNADAWVEVSEGIGYLRHYLLDAGDSFGMIWNESDAMSRRLGQSHYIDLEHMSVDFVTLGLVDRPWRHVERGPAAEVLGYYDVERFDPEGFRNGYPNRAFERRTERDVAWGARIVSRFGASEIRALVETGRFSNALYTEELVRILLGRRERILERYLTRLSPLAFPEVEIAGRHARLCLRDLAVEAGIRDASTRVHDAVASLAFPPEETRAVDHQSDERGRVCVELPDQPEARADAPRYLIVDIVVGTERRETTKPARVHLYQLGPSRYRVVGLERPEDFLPPHG